MTNAAHAHPQMNGLDLRQISHSFGRQPVLDGVSVSVAPGELVCLLGPSGCGKTTLLRIAAGLEPVQKGQVTISGRMVADGAAGLHLPPEARGVGLMFQDYALFPHLDVRANIAFGIADRRAPDNKAWIEKAMRTMGIDRYADSYPHTLSGGQQQRVALLRALAPSPKVLLLDEPFSGLDVTRRAHIRAETLQIIKDAGVAALMVTHDPEEAMFMADRILVMNEGRVVQDGSPIDLYFEPANTFVAALFGPVNRFESVVRAGTAETPLGAFNAAGQDDGTAVEVLIRPEAIVLAPVGADASHARVVTARPLGQSSFIVLDLADGTRVDAKMSGVYLPVAGSEIRVAVTPSQAHVFAAPKPALAR